MVETGDIVRVVVHINKGGKPKQEAGGREATGNGYLPNNRGLACDPTRWVQEDESVAQPPVISGATLIGT